LFLAAKASPIDKRKRMIVIRTLDEYNSILPTPRYRTGEFTMNKLSRTENATVEGTNMIILSDRQGSLLMIDKPFA